MVSMIRFLNRMITRIKRKITYHYEMSKYNNYTIAEYFRKQGAIVGEGCNIAVRNLGTEPYLIKIGNHVNINEGVRLITHDGGTWVFRQETPDIKVFGPIVLEDNCFIGMNTVILPGVRIGKNAIVSANSVVIADVPENCIAMGVPARKFGSIEKYKEKCYSNWNDQKPVNFPYEDIPNWDKSSKSKEISAYMKAHLVDIFKNKMQ